jgi:hypothetical protein
MGGTTEAGSDPHGSGNHLLTQAMEQTVATAMGGFQALCHLSLGEAQLLAGRLEESQALTEQALALTCERQERGHEAYVLCLLGDIAARREHPESAQPKPTTTRPLSWPTNLPCAHSRPTATLISIRCTRR